MTWSDLCFRTVFQWQIYWEREMGIRRPVPRQWHSPEREREDEDVEAGSRDKDEDERLKEILIEPTAGGD